MLKDLIMNEQNYTLTENGALTYTSTTSDNLNLFALGGAVDTNYSSIDIVKLINNALSENFELALKVIFYLSDVREGQGRRSFFKSAMLEVVKANPYVARRLLEYIPEFGRWDYLYWFNDTKLRNDALDILTTELVKSAREMRPSLAFKWAASADASSTETVGNAIITRKHLGMDAKTYRKFLSQGRKLLGSALVERSMSTNKWSSISYDKVPSVAMNHYSRAFSRHDEEGFSKYLTDVKLGKSKINSSVLYPYNIVSKFSNSEIGTYQMIALIEQWKALPNYIEDEGVRPIAVVDTSGSMIGKPFDVASSLGIYLAERLTGPFKDCVVSFSETARMFDLSKFTDIYQKYDYLSRNSIVENTNLQSVFDLLLSTAIKHNVPNTEMPNRIVIISDMEFDDATSNSQMRYVRGESVNESTNLEAIKIKYVESGYQIPQIIFWNVDARNEQVPATRNDKGVVLVSGYSPVALKNILKSEIDTDPFNAMLMTVDVKRYEFINTIIDEFITTYSKGN